MDAATEIWTVSMIEAKLAAGKEITDREWTIYAYSPYGTGGGCHACAPGVVKPIDVTEVLASPNEN